MSSGSSASGSADVASAELAAIRELDTVDSGHVVPDTSATGGGGASLWEVSFRGRPTASMVYDRLPVIDHFVVVDTDPDGRPVTLLAVMNGRGTVSDGEHFWFVLDREG